MFNMFVPATSEHGSVEFRAVFLTVARINYTVFKLFVYQRLSVSPEFVRYIDE